MKRHICILLSATLVACGSIISDKKDTEIQSNKIDTTIRTTVSKGKSQLIDSINSSLHHSCYFVVVADTGLDYYSLRKKMFDLSRELHIAIDTLGRFYNKTKNLIVFPDDDKDNIDNEDYFPAGPPSDNLSLEYLHAYRRPSGEKNIALLVGLYITEKNADSRLAVVHKSEKKAFKIRVDTYRPCREGKMH